MFAAGCVVGFLLALIAAVLIRWPRVKNGPQPPSKGALSVSEATEWALRILKGTPELVDLPRNMRTRLLVAIRDALVVADRNAGRRRRQNGAA